MRILSFPAFFLLASSFLQLSSFAQTAQTQNAPSAAPQQTLPAPQAPQPQTVIIQEMPQPGDPPTKSRPFRKIIVRPPGFGPQKPQPLMGPVDPGIYLREDALLCGAIVSYNFSPGDNPRLMNVTTCTPVIRPQVRYAQGESEKPGPPPAVQPK